MKNYDKLIFEVSRSGRRGSRLPELDVPAVDPAAALGADSLRGNPARLPEITEGDAVRHYTLLSNKNYGVDTGFYPLGSCTMKYNPKLNEEAARMSGFGEIHPLQPEISVQGALAVMYGLQEQLIGITGMDSFTLQPAAGAHGEMTGLMLIKAYHEKRGDMKRHRIIVPDAAHGTNPATAAVVGYEVVEIKSAADGSVDLEALKAVLDDTVAGLMLTNPSTIGLFEKNIKEVARLVHEAGGLLYYDGANLNAIMGITRPGDMGFDVMHVNLHKTFSTPHGGGGPGSGPVGCKERLAEFLPVPVVEKTGESYRLNYNRPDSIGRIKGFYGNFLVLVRAYAYILTMGSDGLEEASRMAVLNANYVLERLKNHYNVPYPGICMHETVLAGVNTSGVPTLDVAKRLLDLGYHPPTIYFPLIVDQAIMIEPTETESLETLDIFIEKMIQISEEAATNPQLLHDSPMHTPVRRIDEVLAARTPVVKYSF